MLLYKFITNSKNKHNNNNNDFTNLSLQYYEPDDEKADIFWIPHKACELASVALPPHPDPPATPQMPFETYDTVPRLMTHIRTRWPHLNRSIEQGIVNHFITLTCDHGPG